MNNRMTNRVRVLLCASALWAVPLLAAAQFPAPPEPIPATPKPAPKAAVKPVERPKPRPARAGEVQTDPIKCWWKTDTTEVRIGQRFTVILTCGVIETPSLKVIPNTSALDPGAVQITPFEVTSGVRHEDILSPPWRYFQYEYQVRLLSEGFFGKDVMLPSLRVTYNVQAASGGGAEGRDLTYQLPQLPMRIASLVSSSATDIRDASNEDFALIETRRFRASTATVVGAILVGFAAVLLIIALARAFGRIRRRRPVLNKPLAPVTALGAALRALATVKTTVVRDGWSSALVHRAQAAIRLAAAVGLGRTFAQSTMTGRAVEREGQLAVTQGLIRRRRVLVSAAPTGETLARVLADDTAVPAKTRASIEALRTALNVFNAAAYGRSADMDTIALDRSLGDSIDAIKQLRMRSLLPFGSTQPEASMTGLGTPSITGDRA